MWNSFDAVIVGAGLAGSVCARQLAEADKKVLVIEKKNHLAGHCYDYLSEKGIYVHKYGPHIFHTDDEAAWRFASRFTDWHFYHHEVLGLVDGKRVPIPFNLNSMEKLFSPAMFARIGEKLIDTFGFGSRVPILKLREHKDPDLQFVAEYVYEKVFLQYTMKQWGKSPEEIDPSVSGRVPVVISRDNRYFHDRFQGIPEQGYTAMVERMLDHRNIQLMLQTDALEHLSIEDEKILISGKSYAGMVIYTGMPDELFQFAYGKLPYRSLELVFEEHGQDYYQENALVNYPGNYEFTRITEYKYFQRNHRSIRGTIISREHPEEYVRGVNQPYYIEKTEEAEAMATEYRRAAEGIPNLHLAGRLAEYRYYDMDEVIGAGMRMVNRIERVMQH